MNQRSIGITLLVGALLMVLSNVADAFADLQSWHGAIAVFTPQMIAPVLKQLAVAGFAALGGKMLPPFGGEK